MQLYNNLKKTIKICDRSIPSTVSFIYDELHVSEVNVCIYSSRTLNDQKKNQSILTNNDVSFIRTYKQVFP